MVTEIKTVGVGIMDGHKNVILVLKPVGNRANNVLPDQSKASRHAVITAAEAVDTREMPTMNRFSMNEC